MKELLIQLRFELAFYRQLLRDQQEEMSPEQIDKVLDRINDLMKAISLLEEKLK